MPRHAPAILNQALLACVVMIVAGSLYPFRGWLPLADWSTDFLFAPPPRYITRNDVSTNLAVYLPFGYLLALRLFRPGNRSLGIALTGLSAAALSTAMESSQVLLPGRIASNLDILLNMLGGLTGALLALHHARWLRAAHAMYLWRHAWFRPHGEATLGLWLLLLWLLTQLALVPQPGVGWLYLPQAAAVRENLPLINGPWFSTLFLELIMIGTFTASLLRPGRYTGAVFMLLAIVFAIKLLAWVMLMKPRAAGGILSPETLAAFVLALWLLLLPSVSRHRKALALILVAGIAFGRLLFVPSPLWPSGSLFNLVGLARHTAALWPWFALAYLIYDLIRRRLRRR